MSKKLREKSELSQIYEGELAIAEEAQQFLESGDFTKEELTEHYQFLIKKYVSLIKQGIKITRIGDSTQSKLIKIQEQLDQQNEELAEKIEQLKISEQRAQEANRAKSVFLASISHELRTPLNAILGFVQLMERSKVRDAEDREYLAIIMRSGEHLLGLINNVLSLSKIEAGKLTLNEQTFNLLELLQSLEEMFRARAHSKGIELVFDVDSQMPQFVWSDEGKLRQILINLLGNAVKFTETGGVALRVKWQDDRGSFEIEDTGYGIGESELSQLFEPFMQTESGQRSIEGTGLGLAISRKFARLMGGDITVKSTIGKGSSFKLEIKLFASEGSQLQRKTRKVIGLATDQPCYRILIVDDKWENRKLLIKLLTSVGLQVKEAFNGKEAIELWRNWAPDLILMDMRMPVMDGYDATREIRQYEFENQDESNGKKAHIPIIALTAIAFEHNRDAILSCGCDDYLAKPFREDAIFEKLTNYLGVRFTYEETPITAINTAETVKQVTPDKLAALPKILTNELNNAVALGDVEAAFRVIDEIRTQDEPLANELRSMIKNYHFDEVQDILEKI